MCYMTLPVQKVHNQCLSSLRHILTDFQKSFIQLAHSSVNKVITEYTTYLQSGHGRNLLTYFVTHVTHYLVIRLSKKIKIQHSEHKNLQW